MSSAAIAKTGPAKTSVFATREDALARARAIAPLLREHAEEADRNRRVDDACIAAISDSGLFRLMAPREFGGSQLGLTSLIEISAEFAAACGSCGWLFAVLGGHNWLMSLFPVETQREFFAKPHALASSVVRLGGEKPTRVPGGFQIRNATGRFSSGIDYADWVIAGVGSAADEGGLTPQYLLVDKRDIEVIDDWRTSGLRGTGSRSLTIRNAFVPEHRAVAIGDLMRGASPGGLYHKTPAYRLPFPQVLAITLSGVPLGLARAGVEAYVSAFNSRIAGWAEEHVSEQSSFFMRIAEASADADAGFGLVRGDCLEIDAAVDGNQTPLVDRTRYLRDISHAAWRCRLAINSLFEASGGSAIYDNHGLQRIWRDINAAAAHNSFVRERSGGMYGRARLGVPPSKFDKIGH